MQQAALRFEHEVMCPRVPQFGFTVDGGVTTFTPMGVPGSLFRDNGLVFDRKGYNHPKLPYFGPGTPMAHSFETLIAKGGIFLCVGTVHGEVHPRLQQCLSGDLRSAFGDAARRHLDEWPHFVLATQLSTHPAY